MIIQIRGTSGSGKSTLVRKVMSLYPGLPETLFMPKRRKPAAYLFNQDLIPGVARMPKLAVMGHYESECGGCDTFKTFDQCFEVVKRCHNSGYHVLMEGVLLYCETKRTLELPRDQLLVIGLDTPIDQCVAGIEARRARKSDHPAPVDPANTEAKHKGTVTYMARLMEAGIRAEWHTRDSALKAILKAIDIPWSELI